MYYHQSNNIPHCFLLKTTVAPFQALILHRFYYQIRRHHSESKSYLK